jgi:hypothetical protein
MTITYHNDLIQGSEEWLAARCGLITASEMKLLLTPTLKVANNDKTRAHVFELLAQRISRYVEPTYIGDDMLRGWADEITARDLYSDRYAPVTETGFITNDQWGFTIGYSPDGLVGDDGLIEVKSRRQKYQVQTIATGEVPEEYLLQLQTGLLVTGRKWVDFISYSGGLPMFVHRVLPDPTMQEAIIEAAENFEVKIAENLAAYWSRIEGMTTVIETDRTVEQEMMI